jgi:hypothetical protein
MEVNVRAQLLEMGFVAIALVAAAVSATAVRAGSDLGPAQAPNAYAGGYPGSPTGPYPGAAQPPFWSVLVAPTQFPWLRIPTLPAPARWDQAAPVFSRESAPLEITESELPLKGQGHGR